MAATDEDYISSDDSGSEPPPARRSAASAESEEDVDANGHAAEDEHALGPLVFNLTLEALSFRIDNHSPSQVRYSLNRCIPAALPGSRPTPADGALARAAAAAVLRASALSRQPGSKPPELSLSPCSVHDAQQALDSGLRAARGGAAWLAAFQANYGGSLRELLFRQPDCSRLVLLSGSGQHALLRADLLFGPACVVKSGLAAGIAAAATTAAAPRQPTAQSVPAAAPVLTPQQVPMPVPLHSPQPPQQQQGGSRGNGQAGQEADLAAGMGGGPHAGRQQQQQQPISQPKPPQGSSTTLPGPIPAAEKPQAGELAPRQQRPARRQRQQLAAQQAQQAAQQALHQLERRQPGRGPSPKPVTILQRGRAGQAAPAGGAAHAAHASQAQHDRDESPPPPGFERPLTAGELQRRPPDRSHPTAAAAPLQQEAPLPAPRPAAAAPHILQPSQLPRQQGQPPGQQGQPQQGKAQPQGRAPPQARGQQQQAAAPQKLPAPPPLSPPRLSDLLPLLALTPRQQPAEQAEQPQQQPQQAQQEQQAQPAEQGQQQQQPAEQGQEGSPSREASQAAAEPPPGPVPLLRQLQAARLTNVGAAVGIDAQLAGGFMAMHCSLPSEARAAQAAVLSELLSGRRWEEARAFMSAAMQLAGLGETLRPRS